MYIQVENREKKNSKTVHKESTTFLFSYLSNGNDGENIAIALAACC
jgi:hypothetical protein